MSCLENTKLEESAFDIFCCEYQDNYEFDSLLISHFADSKTWYQVKEYGCPNESFYDNIFEWVLKWDCEETLRNPIEATRAYIFLEEQKALSALVSS